jgi:hypothetical protein
LNLKVFFLLPQGFSIALSENIFTRCRNNMASIGTQSRMCHNFLLYLTDAFLFTTSEEAENAPPGKT